MAHYPFTVGEEYTKSDIYKICNVPLAKQKGNWNTGYTNYVGDWFIFCGVGTPGRTGHDYGNHFVGDDLVWFGKTASHTGQDSVRSLLNPTGAIYVFYRKESRDPFTFAGLARAKSHKNISPVEITWEFSASAAERPEVLAEEVEDPEIYTEGATKTISVNIYERNPQARKACLAVHGYLCAVCSFDFEAEYGEIGVRFIHVHHLKELAYIGAEYTLNPITDLRPVCPNCHAMLHRKRPAYSIDELVLIKTTAKKSNIRTQ